MTNRQLTVLLMCLLLWPVALRADSIILNGGFRVDGEIVDENDREVRIRRSFSTGGIKYVESIKRSRIERIERSPQSPSTAPAVATQPAAATTHPAKTGILKNQPIGDKLAYMHEAVKKWKSNDAQGAGIALSRLINNCNGTELQQLSADVERETEMPLAELAAEAHFLAAQRAAKGGAVHLYYVTAYELPQLIHRLSDAFDTALQEPVQPNPQNPPKMVAAKVGASQPATEANQNRIKIAAWIDQPDALSVLPAEAAALFRQIQYANSLLAERVRFDADMRKDRSLKSSLLEQRIRLNTLAKVAGAIANGKVEPASPKSTTSAADTKEPPLTPRGSQQDAEQQRQTYLQQAMRLAQEQTQTQNKK